MRRANLTIDYSDQMKREYEIRSREAHDQGVILRKIGEFFDEQIGYDWRRYSNPYNEAIKQMKEKMADRES